METLLDQIALCVERGKINKVSPFPPDLKDKPGADELTQQAIDDGIALQDILNQGLILGMQRIGVKFRENKVFVPDVLMAAKAMHTGMAHLKPHFDSGDIKRKGTFVMGTVSGDLHDIGKNLVTMVVEGGGWEVIDLGIDCATDKYLTAISEHPGCAVGLSALLTTTMVNMEKTVKAIKEKFPETTVLIGGAPITREFCEKIGADCYSPDPQGAVDYLNKLAA